MMKNFVVHISSGEIVRVGVCAEQDVQLQAQQEIGEYAIEGRARDLTDYVDNNEIKPKIVLDLWPTKQTILSDGVDFTIIENIPDEIFVSLNGADPVEVLDDNIVFKTLDKGEHFLTFSGVKYLPLGIKITAI